MAGPALFTVPNGVPFAAGFAAGFWARHGGMAPEEIAAAEIFVNTDRAAREIERALADTAPGSAFLPRIALIGGLGADPLSLPDLPPAIDPLRRHLRLLRLVERFIDADPESAPPLSAAPDLAEALAGLIDEFDEAGVAPQALDSACDPRFAAHWQRTLDFVDLVRRHWPAIRAEAEAGAPDAKLRQRLAAEATAAGWATRPPGRVVIAAGSTGSVASTAGLLAVIALLPRGAVVLPGLDPALDPAIWDVIADGEAPEHPQAPFAGLLSRLGARPPDALPWDDAAPPLPARARLLGQALRPAPITDAWRAAAPELAAEAEAATAGLSLIEAPTERAEAAAIALALRRAIAEPARRAALITADAGLARRVAAELTRYGLVPDDTLGRPLAETAPGIFLRLIAEIAAGRGGAARLAALLGHPLAMAGSARAEHLAHARAYERAALRRRGAEAGVAFPAWPKATKDAAEWHARVERALEILRAPLRHAAPLADVARAHLAAAEALSQPDPDTAPPVWEGEAGAAARETLEALIRHGDAHGPDAVRDYPALLLNRLRGREIRPRAEAPHARLSILGPREARNHAAETVVLGGLNDGVWPALPGADPWLSRPMRADLGLAPPEARTGLAALDFVAAAGRGEVILSRAEKADGAPTLPSRWLVRLVTLLGGVGDGAALGAMRARGAALLRLSAALDLPAEPVPRARRPAATPPLAARPRTLSVTEIERLIADPYEIYAKRVLGLRPLETLVQPLDDRDRGILIHAVVERFVRESWEGLPPGPEAEALLMRAAEAVLAETDLPPTLRRSWRARIGRAAGPFLESEAMRREAGAPLALERRGEITLATPGGPFTLTAKADRIDRLSEGGAAIYDYKTGTPPAPKDIKARSRQQLHLEAAILAQGGFEGLEALEAKSGAYIGLSGTVSDPARERPLPDLGAEAAPHLAKLVALIARYDAGAAYVSRARPNPKQSGDYDHLARRGEWDDAS